MSALVPDWGGKRYYSLDYYLKQTYGEKVYRLSINGGMTCPNRDGTLGTKGCIFCSAGGSGDFAAPASLSITSQIEQAKLKIQSKTNCRKFIAYFQAYTNTYAPVSYLREIFTEALNRPEIVGLSIATRADCISDEVLSLLCELNEIKPVWIELGLQSVHAKTLSFIQSGLTLECFTDTCFRLKQAGIPVIVHLILGLPGESKSDMLESVRFVSNLGIFGIKLQLLHVLKGTELFRLYENEPFSVLSLEEYTDLVAECLSVLSSEIVIHRLTGDGPKNILAAPLWSTDKKRVLNTINRKLKEQNVWQGKYADQPAR